jgi:cytochrome c oxidase subunit I+III
VSAVLATINILVWLWTGTAVIPEKDTKDVGLNLTLPLYASGHSSVGWWAMLITLLGDMTAFVSLVFGYFFYWTIHDDFPPESAVGPGLFWPATAAVLVTGAWLLTLGARRWNRRDARALFYLALGGAAALAIAGAGALLAGPWLSDMNPVTHVYPAVVWVLVLWTALHLIAGVLMHAYCGARRIFGRMTARHDIDICNVTLYWHFVALTTLITAAVVGGFPEVDG